jgi:hypothetical protein
VEQCPPNLLCRLVDARKCFDRWNCAVSFFAPGGLHDYHITLEKWIGD